MKSAPRDIRTIADVVAGHLCSGCGACASVQPVQIRMVDDLRLGRRPVVEPGADTSAALAGCPGVGLSHPPRPGGPDGHSAVIGRDSPWGTVLELWEGHAADPEVRGAASSGGAATALALHAMADEGMYGTLHIAARPDQPLLNHTVLSRNRDELLAATGSRYAPASPADGLAKVEASPAPCVFIGKPCDVAAVAKVRARNPHLDARIGLTIAVFCAGTPSLAGTLEMLHAMGVEDLDDVVGVRYRGNGWPGDATATLRDGSRRQLTYDESWGKVLQKHRPWRCHVCADHTGEFADIAVGDPWYRDHQGIDPGRSLVLARTERGRAVLHRALGSGALVLDPVSASALEASQPNLLRTRGAVWGRIQASHLAGIAAPKYDGLSMLPTWRALGPRAQAQSVAGTLKRIARRRLRTAAVVHPLDPEVLRTVRLGAGGSIELPPTGPIPVVIPARNEEAVIGRTLHRLLRGAEPGELQVVVVCNGCTDGTARAARRFGATVRVLELDQAGKAGALAAGDAEVPGFPRLYLDADVEIDIATVRSLATVLRSGSAEAAAPALRVDLSGSSWPVRAYTRVWAALPSVRDGLAGRGAIAVAESGHRRLGRLAEVVNDDGYIDRVLRDRAVTLVDRQSIVRAPATIGSLLRRRVRVQAGNRQLDALDGLSQGGGTGWRDLAEVVIAQPSLAASLPVFLLVTAVVRRRAAALARRGTLPDWGADTSSRSAQR